MADFTVIQPVRQRFGDAEKEEAQQEQEAPFVGQMKDFPFSCPNVDTGQMGVLQLESLGLTARNNVIQINGVDIPGGLTPGAFVIGVEVYTFWKAHSLLVPANVLGEQNVLHVESVRVEALGGDTSFDNFIVDNIVVFFKTRVRVRGGIGDDLAPRER